jgi:hypothetical protein
LVISASAGCGANVLQFVVCSKELAGQGIRFISGLRAQADAFLSVLSASEAPAANRQIVPVGKLGAFSLEVILCRIPTPRPLIPIQVYALQLAAVQGWKKAARRR